ncbi:MAG: hypothetical protein L0H75_06435 [Nitrosospira sp.]|nr:hypothetical protein [Nitrosospira sp.]
MKTYSILGVTARLVALLALTIGLTAGVHAQSGEPATGTGSQYRSDRPCGGPKAIPCGGGTICVDDPSDQCDPLKEGAKCMGICVAGTTTGDVKQHCGGPMNINCPGGMTCLDDRTDKCNPTQAGAKCPGFCVAGAETGVKHACGGPTSINCPGGTICVDAPTDKCDPKQDGAKCMGFCEVSPEKLEEPRAPTRD